MITEEIKNIKSGTTELRKFSLIMGVALMVTGIALFLKENRLHAIFLLVSPCLILTGLLAPKFLLPIHKVWMTIAVMMGWVMTRLILVVLFYLVITPVGLGARLFGKDILSQKIERDAESYWIKRGEIDIETSDYEKQF